MPPEGSRPLNEPAINNERREDVDSNVEEDPEHEKGEEQKKRGKAKCLEPD